MSRIPSLNLIQTEFERIPAAAVAELLLSPYVDPELLVASTAEAGPAMWIVNRSDVYEESLAALEKHSLSDIASRARLKLSTRRSGLTPIPPPDVPADFREIPDFGVEDILGHPLAPFEVMVHFARSSNEDDRASSALSLTRRVLEHPPRWLSGDPLRLELVRVFGELLLNDPSPFVRTYCARIPIFDSASIRDALRAEANFHVFSKLLQNPAFTDECLELALERLARSAELREPTVSRVAALDRRWNGSQRKKLIEMADDDALSGAVHDWYLAD